MSTATQIGRSMEILLVEDNPGDADLARESMVEAKVPTNLHVAEDGEAAMGFLRRQGAYCNAPRPDLILLDLNLPRTDGHEVLAMIKGDDRLKSIPVVILTTSSREEDILKSYDLHANCYVIKPLNFNRFTEVIRAIENFWFIIATLPKGSHQ